MEQISIPDIPFSILALAPFTSEPNSAAENDPLTVDPLDIDQALAALSPSFYLSLPATQCPAGGMQIQFRQMKDFTPDGLLKSQSYLQKLLAADQFCQEAEQQKMSPQDVQKGLRQWSDLPQLSLDFEKVIKKEESNSLDKLLSMVDLPDSKSSIQTAVSADLGSYAALACQILDTIYSDPIFRSLESSWQSLRYLGRHMADAGAKLTILSVPPNSAETILEKNRELLITHPPSLFLLDQSFGSSVRSVRIMEQLAQLGQEMLVPVLAWVDNTFFQINNWRELNKLSFLPHYLEGASFAGFRTFQQSASGRWLALTCNRFLTRFPYGPENHSRLLPFSEEGLPWQSSVWGVAALMAKRMKQTGWPAGIAALLLEDLALTTEGLSEPGSVELELSENRQEQLSRCGIMPLAGRKRTDTAFLAGDIMVSGDTSLSYQMLVCRVSHFILWCRDHWHDSFTAEELAVQLRSAFRLFAEKQSGTTAGELAVTCKHDEDAIMVSFCWQPSPQILSIRQEILLEFPW